MARKKKTVGAVDAPTASATTTTRTPMPTTRAKSPSVESDSGASSNGSGSAAVPPSSQRSHGGIAMAWEGTPWGAAASSPPLLRGVVVDLDSALDAELAAAAAADEDDNETVSDTTTVTEDEHRHERSAGAGGMGPMADALADVAALPLDPPVTVPTPPAPTKSRDEPLVDQTPVVDVDADDNDGKDKDEVPAAAVPGDPPTPLPLTSVPVPEASSTRPSDNDQAPSAPGPKSLEPRSIPARPPAPPPTARPLSMADRIQAYKDGSRLTPSPPPPVSTGVRVETLRLCIGGMTGSGCCTRIEAFMTQQPGIYGVNVSLLTCRGIFDYDPSTLTPERIAQLVGTLGFTAMPLARESLVSLVLHIGRELPIRVIDVLTGYPGIVSIAEYHPRGAASSRASAKAAAKTHRSNSDDVDGHLQGRAVVVDYDPEALGARTIVRHVQSILNIPVQVSTPEPQGLLTEQAQLAMFRRALLWSLLLALPVLFIEYVVPFVDGGDGGIATVIARDVVPGLSLRDVIGFACATPLLLFVAYPIHESAFVALRFGSRVTMDVLVTLSAALAYVFSVITIALEVLARRPSGVLPPPLGASLPTPAPPPRRGRHVAVGDETFFEITVLLLTLILLGRYIEQLVKARAARSIDVLMQTQAKTAILLNTSNGNSNSNDNADDGDASAAEAKETYIDVLLVERGDVLKVLPGTRVPTDGVVIEGASRVDESMVTGAAAKVPKGIGSAVIGGTLNAHGVLLIRVTHTLSESMLARIVDLVDEAQSAHCQSQRVAEVLASYVATGIVLVAATVFVFWYELARRGRVAPGSRDEGPASFALRFALTVLVISSPGAVSLAVPTAILVATTVGAQCGLLFKGGGRALEALDRVDVVLFDKTGTLTSGRLEVVDFLVASSSRLAPHMTPRRLWTYLAAVERESPHALGRAIGHYARKVHTPMLPVDDWAAVPGCGVRGRVDGHTVCVGSIKWMLDVLRVDVPLDLAGRNLAYQQDGCVVVCLAVDHLLCALVALRDAPRPEAPRVLAELRRRRLQTWLVTGDQRGTALAVAAELGIPEVTVIADALPHQKVDKVRLLQGLGKRVAFIGDGLDDAPALALADVGIALGAGPRGVAIEAADVVLVKDHLHGLVNALDLAAATSRRIRRNVAWAGAYHLALVPIAAGALYPHWGLALPPALAGLSELVAAVPVVLLSLLLRRWTPPFRDPKDDDDALDGDAVVVDIGGQTTTTGHHPHRSHSGSSSSSFGSSSSSSSGTGSTSNATESTPLLP